MHKISNKKNGDIIFFNNNTLNKHNVAGGRMKCEYTNKNSFLLIVLLISIDQLTKYIIRFFGGFYICNKGIAFGMTLPVWLILALIIAIILSVGALSLNYKFKNLAFISNLPADRQGFKFSFSNYPSIFILSGAISNLIDRLYYGCVIDFIDLRIWPVFNLADIFICLGAFLLILKLSKK